MGGGGELRETQLQRVHRRLGLVCCEMVQAGLLFRFLARSQRFHIFHHTLSATHWNAPTISRSKTWRRHSQGDTNSVENETLWRWRAPLGLLSVRDQRTEVLSHESEEKCA